MCVCFLDLDDVIACCARKRMFFSARNIPVHVPWDLNPKPGVVHPLGIQLILSGDFALRFAFCKNHIVTNTMQVITTSIKPTEIKSFLQLLLCC